MIMKTYVRPMGSWWLHNLFYRWYMVRESSCIVITVYAVILLWGLMRLVEGLVVVGLHPDLDLLLHGRTKRRA